jgi:hypothetical protein
MHRATSPFVAGKYALKRTFQQYQFFWRHDKLLALFILLGLILTRQAVRVL